MVEEPVCKGWVLYICLGMSSSGVKVVRADKLCQLWPLEICCTMSLEDGGQTQCVNHGEEATPLMLPVVLWCHADWKRSGTLGWRKPEPAADELLSPPVSQRPISAAKPAADELGLLSF